MTEMFVVGLSAETGEARWQFDHPSREHVNIPNVLWLDDEYVLAFGINQNAMRLARISRDGDSFTAVEVWSERIKIKSYQTPALRFGDYAYVGEEMLLYCFKWKTGEMVWRVRDYPHAYFVQAGERTILLDGEGKLSRVKLSPEGIETISSTQLFDTRSWTNPTLVGTTLYARSRREIKAVDLSKR